VAATTHQSRTNSTEILICFCLFILSILKLIFRQKIYFLKFNKWSKYTQVPLLFHDIKGIWSFRPSSTEFGRNDQKIENFRKFSKPNFSIAKRKWIQPNSDEFRWIRVKWSNSLNIIEQEDCCFNKNGFLKCTEIIIVFTTFFKKKRV